MSQLKVNSIVDASGGSNAVLYGPASPAGSMGFRNRIINGAMVIDQRNAGAAVTTPDVYVTDRWQQFAGGGGAITWQQSSTAPAGFKYSLSATVTTADSSLGTSDYYFLRQFIEGFNSADLEFGTANAKTVTLSFWVRSSLTGTFGGCLQNGGGNRFYPFTYTISSANTWEYKNVTIAGDTTGTWLTTNGAGIGVDFSLGFGSNFIGTAGSWTASQHYTATGATNVIATNGATFYITGVQLEVGSVATEFERRPYGTELALCQRYYEQSNYASATEGIGFGYAQQTNVARYGIPIAVKRAAPTVNYSGTLAVEYGAGSVSNVTSFADVKYGGGSIVTFYATCGSVLTIGQGANLYANGTTVSLTFNSEL